MQGTILTLVRIAMPPKHVIRRLPIHVLCRKTYRTVQNANISSEPCNFRQRQCHKEVRTVPLLVSILHLRALTDLRPCSYGQQVLRP